MAEANGKATRDSLKNSLGKVAKVAAVVAVGAAVCIAAAPVIATVGMGIGVMAAGTALAGAGAVIASVAATATTAVIGAAAVVGTGACITGLLSLGVKSGLHAFDKEWGDAAINAAGAILFGFGAFTFGKMVIGAKAALFPAKTQPNQSQGKSDPGGTTAGSTSSVAGGEGNKITEADKAKISKWTYPPEDELYLKNKEVYDNPKYFDQATGKTIYPGTNGDPNINGFINGEHSTEVLKPGKLIDRIGTNGTGQYFSPAGSSFESRALPPYMESQPCTTYRVLQPFEVQSGKAAPWFDQFNTGTQYFSDGTIKAIDGSLVPFSVENLIINKYITPIIP